MDAAKNQFVNSAERKVEFFQYWFNTTWFMVLISDMRPIQILLTVNYYSKTKLVCEKIERRDAKTRSQMPLSVCFALLKNKLCASASLRSIPFFAIHF